MASTIHNDDLLLERARVALDGIKSDAQWQAWLTIGIGLRICREHALRVSQSDDMATRRAKDAMAAELKRTTLDRLDKATRSDLLAIIDDPAVEKWRETLSAKQRESWTHPRTVNRHYRRAVQVQVKDKAPPRPAPVRRRSRPARWRDAVKELRTLQDDYRAWLAKLPESLQSTATADLLREIDALDLDSLEMVELPKGFGRD